MIIKKYWVSKSYIRNQGRVRYHYTGWFLLGIIPLFISRQTEKRD